MRKRFNILLSGIIALLSGCVTQKKAAQESTIVALYGVPYATYDISGKVTQNNHPVADIPIVVKGHNNQQIGDTVHSDKKGQFQIIQSEYPTSEIKIVAYDPNTLQPTDSLQVPTEYTNQQSGRGFYRGECKIEIEIPLKDKSNK